jgi:DNA polymerase bacteriophage-type
VYKLMASKIYRIPAEEIDKQQRQVGKVVILGAGYGVGHHKLKLFLKMQAGVDATEDEAKRIIDAYRHAYYKIPELWRKADEALIALRTGNGYQVDEQGLIKAVPGKGLTLPSGLFIQYPDLAKVTDEKTKKDQLRYFSKGLPVYIYGGKVVENVCQAVARQVVAEQMLRIGKKYKVVLTVHDAVACIAPIDDKVEAQKYVEECMSWRPKWAQTLPLACESGVGASYGDC